MCLILLLILLLAVLLRHVSGQHLSGRKVEKTIPVPSSPPIKLPDYLDRFSANHRIDDNDRVHELYRSVDHVGTIKDLVDSFQHI